MKNVVDQGFGLFPSCHHVLRCYEEKCFLQSESSVWMSVSTTCNTPVLLQNSLTRSAPIPSDAQGRSGARFHTSYNKKYVIKIITSEDVAEMHNILKKYHQVTGRPTSSGALCFKVAILSLSNHMSQ